MSQHSYFLIYNIYVLKSEKEGGLGMAWLGGSVGLEIVGGPAIGSYLNQSKGCYAGLAFIKGCNHSLGFFVESLNC